jgi:hypothetical protein
LVVVVVVGTPLTAILEVPEAEPLELMVLVQPVLLVKAMLADPQT